MSKFYLKDWHGKEKEFTDEKIFVRGENGELIQFTQGEGAVVQPLEVTESGTYTAPDGVDGYSPVTVNVASSGGGGGVPFLKMIGAITTNTNNTSVDTVQNLYIPKGATILRAWTQNLYNVNKSYTPTITNLKVASLESLQIDTSNANWDIVSYTHKSGLGSYSSTNAFAFRVLVATDALTVKDAGGGLFAGTVNRDGQYCYFSETDISVEQIMYLKTLDLAEGVTEAPAYVAYNQIFLESVDLSNATSIGASAFYGCTSLKSVSIDNATSIGGSAFCGCTSLKSVSINSNVTDFGVLVFSGCASLESVSLSPNLTTLGKSMFNGCTSLKTIPLSNVTVFGESVFSGCTSLESISLSPNLTTLGNYVFRNCTSLSGEITIPNAITQIPSEAFKGTKFDRVVFPAGLTTINYDAFGGCTHPTEFDFSACTKVPSMITASYLGTPGNGQVLKIPAALFDTWSTQYGWKDWAAQMVAV